MNALFSRLVRGVFRGLAHYVSFGFAVAFFGVTSGWFGGFYTFFFAAPLLPAWGIENYGAEILALLAGMPLATLGHCSQFGLLHRFGFSGWTPRIRRINQMLSGRAYKSLDAKNADDAARLQELYADLLQLPVTNMLAAIFYALAVLLLVVAVNLIVHGLSSTPAIIFAGWLLSAFVHGGFAFIITDHLIREQRIEIKSYLQRRAIQPEESRGRVSLKLKFAYLLALVLMSLALMAFQGILGNQNVWLFAVFLTMSFASTGILMHLYLSSIIQNLERINEAADDLAAGGRGLLKLSAAEREFIDFSRNFELATAEVFYSRRGLESRVQERTAELQRSLEDLNVLKQQQDGDYFLTSLLIHPLSPNRVSSNQVRVEFLTDQKKKFQFRKWSREIGGDICVAHSVRLRGRPCTVFLNGDAMGKSMQGAGGALVLGAAFQAIIDRTHSVDSLRLYPEMWMESAYRQLHAIFESFEGSMLVSIALGLIEDETGMLYYLNAEHPWTAIYEKGEARFIENDVDFRKLGTPDSKNDFRVQTRRLEPGAILIAGSDGRDDILVSQASEGAASALLDDESQFLRFIEEGEGDLDAIKAAMLRRGELTDDLSLLRVEYVGAAANFGTASADDRSVDQTRQALRRARALQRAEDFPGAVAVLEERLRELTAIGRQASDTAAESNRLRRELTKCRMQLKDYPEAARCVMQYLDGAPQDTDMLVLAVHLHKRARKFETALELAERAFLRNPGIVRNLAYLAELHGHDGRYERAAFFLESLKELAPDHPRIQKIESYLKSSYDKLARLERPDSGSLQSSSGIASGDLRHAAGSHH